MSVCGRRAPLTIPSSTFFYILQLMTLAETKPGIKRRAGYDAANAGSRYRPSPRDAQLLSVIGGFSAFFWKLEIIDTFREEEGGMPLRRTCVLEGHCSNRQWPRIRLDDAAAASSRTFVCLCCCVVFKILCSPSPLLLVVVVVTKGGNRGMNLTYG